MFSLLFEDALPPALFEPLRTRIVGHENISALSDHSFWYPLDAPARTYVEHAIQSLARLLPTTDGVIGAEWWVPAMKASQGMEWHCDCDRIIYARERRFVHPMTSSVLYLGGSGGPTLVVDDIATDHTRRRPRTAGGAVGYQPMPNRFGIFPGDRFHAVAASDGDELRVTMPINWWAQKPKAPLCIETPYAAPEIVALAAPPALNAPRPASRAAPLIRLSSEQVEQLPHRFFCPVYDSRSGS